MEKQPISTEKPEQNIVDSDSERLHQIGAQALASINFEQRHRGIVDSSFGASHRRGEKLHSQKPAHRRNEAYLTRLERLINEHGNSAEKRVWRQSVNNLLIQPENIPESYWRQQEQIMRDAGRGDVHFDQEDKERVARDIRRQQKASLSRWSTYLGAADNPYPLWFKVYAWEGMSKMGTFDKSKGEHTKRDKTTVAPYPRLNEAVLARVYSIVSDFYGYKPGQDDNAPNSNELNGLVASGNFNRLYSGLMLKQKAAIEVPKDPRDVHGEWVEYRPGQEEQLANAAEGTPWCIASSDMGHRYLGDKNDDNNSRFILLHLKDPNTGILAESACASIRIDKDGNVAEISGLQEGQTLDESLIDMVEDKALEYPGGERFLAQLADNKKLIALDRKMRSDEPLTAEEYEFLFEVSRSIHQKDFDERPYELREHYGDLRTYLSSGARITAWVACRNFNLDDVTENLDYINDLIRTRPAPKIVQKVEHLPVYRDTTIEGGDEYYEEAYGDIKLPPQQSTAKNIRPNNARVQIGEKQKVVYVQDGLNNTPLVPDQIIRQAGFTTKGTLTIRGARRLISHYGIAPNDILQSTDIDTRTNLAKAFAEEHIDFDLNALSWPHDSDYRVFGRIARRIDELSALGYRPDLSEIFEKVDTPERIDVYSKLVGAGLDEGGIYLESSIESMFRVYGEVYTANCRGSYCKALQAVKNPRDFEILSRYVGDLNKLIERHNENKEEADHVKKIPNKLVREALLRSGATRNEYGFSLSKLFGSLNSTSPREAYAYESPDEVDINELMSHGISEYDLHKFITGTRVGRRQAHLLAPVFIKSGICSPVEILDNCVNSDAPTYLPTENGSRGIQSWTYGSKALRQLVDAFSDPQGETFMAVAALERGGISAEEALSSSLKNFKLSHGGEWTWRHNGRLYAYELNDTPSWTQEDFVEAITQRIYTTIERHKRVANEYHIDETDNEASSQLSKQLSSVDFVASPDLLPRYLSAIMDNVIFNRGGDGLDARIRELTSGQIQGLEDLTLRLSPSENSENLEILLEYGVNPNQLVTRLERPELAKHRDSLIKAGADADYIEALLQRS